MSYSLAGDEQIKNIFKQAILEVFQEQKELFYDLFVEVIEDVGLLNAIKEGEDTELASREEVFAVLEGNLSPISITIDCAC